MDSIASIMEEQNAGVDNYYNLMQNIKKASESLQAVLKK